MSDNNQLIDALASQGWACQDDFVAPQLAAALFAETERALTAGQLHPAAIGRGDQRQIRTDIRGDHIQWLDASRANGPVAEYFNQMDALRTDLNRALFIGVDAFECHIACYPAGTHYARHVDRHHGSEARLVSAICYLNPDWHTDDGGQLLIYADGPDAPPQAIEPRAGRLAIFITDDLWHEVLPARRERHSLTGWFRRRNAMPGL